jgi:tetratricopeptide (TPR) repeat protein
MARAWLGRVYAECGEKQRAEDALSQLLEREKERQVDSWCLAEIYEVLGRKEEALERLEKAYEERSPNMIYLKLFAESRFKELSSEPRYQELLRLMAFK